MKQQELLEILSEINVSMEKLHILLCELLDHPAKNYSIQYGNEHFEFNSAFDFNEAQDKAHRILRFVELLMIDEFTAYIKNTPRNISFQELSAIFCRMIALTQGVEPKDMELEKIKIEDIYEVTDKDGKIIKSLPLNFDNFQVKNQRPENSNEHEVSS